MSEATPEAEPAQEQPTENNGDDAKTESTDWKAEARKWETRAKENGQAAKELEKQRQATMSEAEKAAVEAEQRGRTAAAQEFGSELAQERFNALAARRNKDFDTGPALEFVDLSKFLGDDGRPNAKAIESAVERLVPAPADGPPSFDGGSRSNAPAPAGMNDLLRKAAGRA